MINLAQVYKNGKGINRDLDKAIYWYGQAITHGHDEFLDDVKELVKERNAQLKKVRNCHRFHSALMVYFLI